MTAIKHLVLFRFKPTTTDALIEDAFQRLADLKDLIPGIAEFMGGPLFEPGRSESGLHPWVRHNVRQP